MKSFFREIFRKIPKFRPLYILCQRYVDDYRGEHNSDMHSNGEFDFLRRNIEEFNIIFDVGANRGDWTKKVLELKSDAEIHCFEPSSFTFKKLAENSFPANVICNNFGLSSKKEDRGLFIFENGAGRNSLYRREGVQGKIKKEEQISVDTLENYCKKRNIKSIDFIKLDVEGHELEALKGMRKLLKENRIKMIQFEYGGCDIDSRVFLKDIFDFLKGLDYKIYKIFPNNLVSVENYIQDLENFRYVNYLVSRRDITPK